MSDEGSVSAWLMSLRTNGDEAARQLWDRYFRRQLAVARRELAKHPRNGEFDEEDVAVSAFDAFCLGMRQGRHEDVVDRNHLWRMLFVITVRKANDYADRQNAQKRGGDGVGVPFEDLSPAEVDRFLSNNSDPMLSVAMSEECDRLLKALNDPGLEQLALLKLDGHTNHEIAELLGCVRQTVQRRLNLIREIWESL